MDAYEVEGAEPNSERATSNWSSSAAGSRGTGWCRRPGAPTSCAVHMNRLGVPILHDPLYPVVRDDGPEDFTRPLQLLARALEFTDPFTGAPVRFESRLRLGPSAETSSALRGVGPGKEAAGLADPAVYGRGARAGPGAAAGSGSFGQGREGRGLKAWRRMGLSGAGGRRRPRVDIRAARGACMRTPLVVAVMGVSGTGKSTVGPWSRTGWASPSRKATTSIPRPTSPR